MQIKIEEITNKNIINFYISQKLATEQTAVLATPSTKYSSVLIQNIMQIKGIEKSLFTDELVAVTLSDNKNIEDIKALVMAEIDDFFNDNQPLIAEKNQAEIAELAEAVANSFIRPTLNRDKGDIQILKIENNSMELQFTGHCAGCPYAKNTLNNIIIKTFNKYIP